jgi:nicotinamidase-related amidase
MKQYVEGSYSWPFDGDLRVENTALLIIDMQVDYCGRGGWFDQLRLAIESTRRPIEPLNRVLQSMRQKGFYVLHTRESYRPDLSDLNANRQWRKRQYGLGIGDSGTNGRILVRGEPGCEFVPELEPLPGEPLIDKPGMSGFYATDLDQILRRQRTRNLVIGGVTTDGSVQSTLRDANDRGYECLLLEDCSASVKAEDHDDTLEVLSIVDGLYGSISDSKTLLDAIA